MDADGVLSLLFHAVLLLLLTLVNGLLTAAEHILDGRRTGVAAAGTATGNKVSDERMENARRFVRSGVILTCLGWVWTGEKVLGWAVSPIPEPAGSVFAMLTAFTLAFWLQSWWGGGFSAPREAAAPGAQASIDSAAHRRTRLLPPLLYEGAVRGLRWFGADMGKGASEPAGFSATDGPALMEKIARFTDRMVREIMVPRVDMICLYADHSFEENWSVIRRHRHTRYPLCEKDKDRVLGIVHIHDIYDQAILLNEPFSFRKITRPEVVVPETMDLTQTLRTLQEKRAGMAIVVDEFGGTSGLVTTADITEEIFGDIQDEFDQSPPLFANKAEGVSIHPRALIAEVNQFFRITIDDPDNDTIGGWLFSRLEKVPEKGDRIRHEGWEFMVEKAHDRWIDRLLARAVDGEAAASPGFRPTASEEYAKTSLL